MPVSTEIPYGQEWLIKYMQASGYKSNSGGICFGVSHMGMQAILSKDTASFDNRLYQIYQDNLHPTLDAKARNIQGITPFLDGVEIYFQPHLYPHLFEKGKVPHQQDPILTTPIIMSREIQKHGGIYKAVDFTGIYSKNELKEYFMTIKKVMHSTVPEFSEPVAITMTAERHSITVGFDPKQDTWMLINTNQLPTKYIPSDEVIARSVMAAFGAPLNAKIILASDFIVTKDQSQNIDKFITHLKAHDNWKQCHQITADKLQFVDKFDASLLWSAVRYKDVETAKAILAHPGVDPNKADSSGYTPLCLAVFNEDVAMTKALLAHPSTNPNLAVKDGNFPLSIALFYGSRDIAKILLDHPSIDLNKTTKAGNSLLSMVLKNNLMDTAILDHKEILINNEGDILDIPNQEGRINFNDVIDNPVQVAQENTMIQAHSPIISQDMAMHFALVQPIAEA